MIRTLVDGVVLGNLGRRSEDAKWTGEWLIFVPHQGANYYLSIGSHNEGDVRLREQIEEVCFHEFPFLRDILTKRL
jgi:hypothetical protein